MDDREDLCSFLERTIDEAEAAFVPAGVLWQNRFKTYKAFKKWLDATPEVHQQNPRANRLLIHAGDWDRYWQERDQRPFAMLDAQEPAEIVATFVEDAKARAEAIRNSNAEKRRDEAPPLDALIRRMKDKK
jgi:hypothetical protein